MMSSEVDFFIPELSLSKKVNASFTLGRMSLLTLNEGRSLIPHFPISLSQFFANFIKM